MAHNLAVINGRTAMAYQGETPWHSLGTFQESINSVHQALEVANLDWSVALADMFYRNAAGDTVRSSQRRAVLREDSIKGTLELGTVGMQYRPIQNDDAFAVLQPAIEEYGITIEAAGALGNGERSWMLAKMPEASEPVPGDSINSYMLVINGHDGMCGHHAIPTRVRVVCQNTFQAATGLGNGNKVEGAVFTVRHTKSADDRLKAAAEMVKKMMASVKANDQIITQLYDQKMSAKDVVAYIESVFPNPNPKEEIGETLKERRATVARLVWEGHGAALAGADANGATAWAANNAVTEYFDHVRPAEAKSDKARQTANESAIFGANADVKLLALNRAMRLVAAA
jgi:phage/plasmid-like protein (TIGR03299 family)